MKTFWIALGCFLLLCSSAWADDPQARFDEANRLSAAGQGAKALEIYEELIAQGWGGANLYYNLGTTYLKSGDLGRGVWRLEQALLQNPDCEDCRANLEQAAKQQKDKVIVEAKTEDNGLSLDGLMNAMSFDGFAMVFLPFWMLFFASLWTWRISKGERARFLSGLMGLLFFIAALASGGLLLAKAYAYEDQRYAVVLGEEVEVRTGPNINFESRLKVHTGLKVRLGEKVEDWRQIWLENGLNGYLQEEKLGIIAPEE